MLLSAGMLFAIMTGCSDPSDYENVRNDAITNLQRGGMIDFDDIRQSPLLISDDPNTATYSAVIYDPNNTAASYNVGINVGGTRVQLGDAYTTFPTTMNIEGSDMRVALGSDVEFGENYEILGEVTTDNGTVFDSTPLVVNTNANGESTVSGGSTDFEILGARNPQALRFPVIPVCESVPVAANFAGTWEIDYVYGSSRVTSQVNIDGNIVNIVAGPGTNEFTIQNLWGQGNDFIAELDGRREFVELPEFDFIYDELKETGPQLSYVEPRGARRTVSTEISRVYEGLGGNQGIRNPRVYGCDDLIVLRLLHTQTGTSSQISTFRSIIKLRKQ